MSVHTPDEWLPRDTSEVISWQGHIPFAFSLVRLFKPECFVELGTHKGDSYMAFCEAVERFSSETVCFAVDNWGGDEHAGFYGSEVLDQLRVKHDQRYGCFSTLMCSNFDDAVGQFQDKSIDLLHIDGLHTYEAVSHDFETWKSKLSDRGIVLFHDTEERQGSFGVWRYWEELCEKYPHFKFYHSHGLGILAVGKKAARLLPDLFDVDEETSAQIRSLYRVLGNSVAFHGLSKLISMERDYSATEIERLNNVVLEREAQYVQVSQEQERLSKLIEEERQIAGSEIERLNNVVLEREEQYVQVNCEKASLIELVENERLVSAAEIKRLNDEILKREEQFRQLNQELFNVLNSEFWRVSSPIRRLIENIGFLFKQPKIFFLLLMRKIYHNLPVSIVKRNKLKDRLYRYFPRIFSHTLSFKLWQSQCFASFPEKFDLRQPVGESRIFELQCPQDPVVSIIIPVYGKIEYTIKCLRSLWSHRSSYSFEVIIVDDFSPDDTLEVLKAIKGVRIVCNETNSGFIRSCNNGASHARGELLVMLNNDTVVKPGWLDELVNTFNCVPGAGLAGSKLIYPDGRLQEAGGIIWRDGSGWNYGRLQDPNMPEYCYLRDIDYCSGASLMITRALFDQLGGFDIHYSPAYGEDSDLAFRVRKAGYRVVYQPLSQVIHFEGITSGTEVSSGIKAYQVANAKKLYERWQSVLARHGEPGIKPEIEKDRRVSGRVLVLDHCTPTPDQDAGSITAFNLMRIFQGLGFKVTFAPEDNFLYMDPYTCDLQRIGIECLYAPYVTSVEQHLVKYGGQYDVVVVFRLLAAERNLELVRKYCKNAKLVFHTSDLHHLREMREAELAGSEVLKKSAEKTRNREMAVIQSVDGTIVHSSEEKEMLDIQLNCENKSESRIFLFPWAIEIPGTQVAFDQRNGMLFIGGFNHQPNVDAVLYFAKEIFPLVRQQLPDAVFRIVGSKAPQKVLDLAGDGIEVLGFVENLRPVMDQCCLSVVPLRYGAGIKGKIGTSLSFGLPCVSTSIGVEGMDLYAEDGVLVADNPVDFARAIVHLQQDEKLWESCSRGGLDFVQRNYSLESGIDTVGKLLIDIGVHKGKMVRNKINLLPGTEGCDSLFIPDQMDDPLRIVCDIQSKAEYVAWSSQPEQDICREVESSIAKKHSLEDIYHLPGFCRVCNQDVNFLVDRQCGAVENSGICLPNWRERLVCPVCSLNNRQRAIACAVRDAVKRYRDKRPDVYLMEQVTSIFHWMASSMPQANCIGSEYLGQNILPGKIVKGIRHEDVEQLSFRDGNFDLIISNDVLEHVVNPRKALAEAFRVLRPQGQLLMTVPFHISYEKSQCRAQLLNGKLEHLLSPVYHGNPVSNDGSLVFNDFGWDFLQDLRDAGFSKVVSRFYWSEVYGHLGEGQHYIYAFKD